MSQKKEQDFLDFLKEISLNHEAIGLLEWDSQTGMPEKSANYRAEVSSYLSAKAFGMSTGKEMTEFMTYFTEFPEELSVFGRAVFEKEKEDYELNKDIPKNRFHAFRKVQSKAHSEWVMARNKKDFSLFQPSLSQLIEFTKEFIPLWKKDETTPYDVLLNQYEPGMTVEILDQVFAKVREGIMAIRKELEAKGKVPKTDFLHRFVSKEQQRAFVTHVVEELGFDFSKGRLDDTVHPFMLNVNRKDTRITTRWDETDFTMATFGVIHEAGHGMYEQNVSEKFDYTPLAGGVSMGIHESQSLFNEIIIGSSRAFWQKQFPVLQKLTEGTFDDIDFETFYRGLNETKASLIRIESDSLTYPLHIIIRYEIEKMIFNDDVSVEELPKIWNDKYEEYLGIRPLNDLDGILQDVHWSGASFGYFPSYALGYMYAAQLHHAMEETFDFDAILTSSDYSPIREWLTEHIHQYGSSRKPNQLIIEATGESLTPTYLLAYLKKIYYKVYQID